MRAALDLFRLYATARPDDAYAWLGLGRAQERAGALAEATSAYARSLQSEPDDEEIRSNLAKPEKSLTRPAK